MTDAERLARAIYLLNCAVADLEGMAIAVDPDGQDHPCWTTIDDIDKFLSSEAKLSQAGEQP